MVLFDFNEVDKGSKQKYVAQEFVKAPITLSTVHSLREKIYICFCDDLKQDRKSFCAPTFQMSNKKHLTGLNM